jgi:hypothetical protein
MIAPTRAYDGLPALTAEEAAEWMIIAAKRRPAARCARVALFAATLDIISPQWVNAMMKRQRIQPGR